MRAFESRPTTTGIPAGMELAIRFRVESWQSNIRKKRLGRGRCGRCRASQGFTCCCLSPPPLPHTSVPPAIFPQHVARFAMNRATRLFAAKICNVETGDSPRRSQRARRKYTTIFAISAPRSPRTLRCIFRRQANAVICLRRGIG
jgi:hypothetical protein